MLALEKFEELAKFVPKFREITGYHNKNEISNTDIISTLILSQILDEIKSLKTDKVAIELSELNKTQLLLHIERKGLNKEEFEKLTKEDILDKIK